MNKQEHDKEIDRITPKDHWLNRLTDKLFIAWIVSLLILAVINIIGSLL